MGRRTGGDDRQGDVDATPVSRARKLCGSRFRRQGRILAQKRFAAGVL